MKTFILFFVSVMLISCSKDEDTSVLGSGNLTMKINGTLWSGNIITNLVDETTENTVVQAINSSAESFGFTIEDFTGIGDYPTAQGASFTVALYARKDKVVFNAGAEINYKVTSMEGSGVSKKAHGTFSGTMKSTTGEVLTITEGKF